MTTNTGILGAEKQSTASGKLYVCGYNGFKQIASEANPSKDSKWDEIIDEPIAFGLNTDQDVIVKVETSLTSTFMLWGDGRVSVTGWVPGTSTNTGNIKDLLPGQVIQDISCVDETLMFVTKAGKLLSWNNYTVEDSSPIEVEVCRPISQVTCGDIQSIVSTDDGSIGEVVLNPNPEKKEGEYHEVSLVVNTINFAFQVLSVDCGKEHVLLLTKTGQVFSFGGGSRGQLGNGNLEAQVEPKLVEALDGIEVTKIACGGWHSAVISDSCDVYSWGWNKDGQVGVSDTHQDTQTVQVQAVPFPLTFNDNDIIIVDVSCGSRHTAVVTSCGEVWTWGWGFYGQLGHSNRKTCLQPTKILAMKSRVSRVWCSQWNTFILVEQK